MIVLIYYSRFNLKTIQCYWDEFFATSVPLANSTQEKFILGARCYTRLSFIVNWLYPDQAISFLYGL